MNYYQMSRPSQGELRIIQAKLFAQFANSYLVDKSNLTNEEREDLIRNIVAAVMTGKTLKDAESERIAVEIRQNDAPLVEEQMTLILIGKINASYWLGLVTYERGNYPSAFDYFGKYTLNAWPGGPQPWTAGAIYNLGRTLEAEGKIDQAAKIYRSNATAADAAGQFLRGKWLREAEDKKAEVEKTEAAKIEEKKDEEAKPDDKKGEEAASDEKKSEEI